MFKISVKIYLKKKLYLISTSLASNNSFISDSSLLIPFLLETITGTRRTALG